MNTRIIKIGMDVHSTNYTLCAMESKWNEPSVLLRSVQVEPKIKNIIKFIDEIKQKAGSEIDITCAYEAGGLGTTIQRELTDKGIKCVIMAPTTMKRDAMKNRKKSDFRDAQEIAELLIGGGYRAVHVLSKEDESIKDYIRMREDQVKQAKQTKQHINAFCLRKGHQFEGTKWTERHRKWLNELELEEIDREVLEGYLLTLNQQEEQIEKSDNRIEELSTRTEYVEKVKKLACFLGIKTLTAMTCVVEAGDFSRFRKAKDFASFLGLVPGEHSSAESSAHMGITKAGNGHLRKALIESADSICKGKIGHKSKDLRRRQKGSSSQVIAYADKANIRLRKKYYRMVNKKKDRKIAVAAVARELACFIWGMMTNNYDRVNLAA